MLAIQSSEWPRGFLFFTRDFCLLDAFASTIENDKMDKFFSAIWCELYLLHMFQAPAAETEIVPEVAPAPVPSLEAQNRHDLKDIKSRQP